MLCCNLESPGIFCDVTNVMVTPTALGAFINYLYGFPLSHADKTEQASWRREQ